MTKAQKLFIAIRNVISSPSSIRRMVDEESEWKKHLDKKYGFHQLMTVDLLDFIPGFSETIGHYTFLEGTSLPTDLAMLKSLARKIPHCSYLEIGSWRGESLANVAEVAEKCVSVTLSAEEMKEMGMNNEFINAHGFFSRNFKNIKTIEHNSLTFNFASLGEKFDLIFVDGDHHYSSVKSDTEKVIQLLKNENAVIVWHDYAFNPDRVRYEVLAAILDGLPKEEHKNLYHISNTLCAVYSRKPFSGKQLNLYGEADKVFSVTLSAEKV